MGHGTKGVIRAINVCKLEIMKGVMSDRVGGLMSEVRKNCSCNNPRTFECMAHSERVALNSRRISVVV